MRYCTKRKEMVDEKLVCEDCIYWNPKKILNSCVYYDGSRGMKSHPNDKIDEVGCA